jgi:hypothetical protein
MHGHPLSGHLLAQEWRAADLIQLLREGTLDVRAERELRTQEELLDAATAYLDELFALW